MDFQKILDALTEQQQKVIPIGKAVIQEIEGWESKQNPNWVYQLVDFVKAETKSNDGSHQMDHFRQTSILGMYLTRNLFNLQTVVVEGWSYEKTMVIVYICCMVHDVVDHKYKGAKMTEANFTRLLSEAGFNNYPYVEEGDSQVIFDVIQNISFSKMKIKGVTSLGRYENVRRIVSDADKLDALGFRGLFRVFMYTGATKGTMLEAIIHFDEKLLKLDDWLYFEASMKLAEELMIPLRLARAVFKITDNY
jgi:uncharacterized protein